MEFDQSIFSYFYKKIKNRKIQKVEIEKSQHFSVELEDIKETLGYFAAAVFKRPIEIRHTEDLPYISTNKIFLPGFIAIMQTKEDNYLYYKILILHLFAVEQFLRDVGKKENLEDEALIIEQNKDKLVEYLANCFPNYLESYQKISTTYNDESYKKYNLSGFNANILWGRLPRSITTVESANTSQDTQEREALPDGGFEMKNTKSARLNKINLEEDKENIGQDVFHHFEKLETLEEFKGIQREMDGADELEAHADALDELNLEEVIRSSKGVQSVYKTELDTGFEVSDLKDQSVIDTKFEKFYYDEWDGKKNSYKKEWCTLIHEYNVIQSNSEQGTLVQRKNHLDILTKHVFIVNSIKKKLIQLSTEVFVKKKLLDGRYLDIDNFIRGRASLLATKSSDGRFYKEIVKRHRDTCVLMLVDNSLSSDSWVQNKRVLDLCLESLLIFGEASSDLGDPMMIAGFNSNTRNACKFSEWKSFEGSWASFKGIVNEIKPDGYTRIGPAIRHATYLLEKRKEKKKILLIFTDGRPTDYDRYEGSYGLSDVRKSITEAENLGIIPFAIAVDPGAKQFLPNLFGQGNYQILMNIEKFPEILTKLYIKISKGN